MGLPSRMTVPRAPASPLPAVRVVGVGGGSVVLGFLQEIVPIMDLAVNEEFTRMYSEDELMGARRIQVHIKSVLSLRNTCV